MEIIASYRVSQRQNHFTSHQQEEIKKLNKEGKRVINLGRGNPDQPTFQPIVEEFLKASVKVENQGYPPYGGKESLKEAIRQKVESKYVYELVNEKEYPVPEGVNE